MSDDGEPSRGPRAVVAAHGDLAGGFASAVAQITGRGTFLLPLSNRGLSGDAIEDALASATAESGARVIFTDLPDDDRAMLVTRHLRADTAVPLRQRACVR